jgi:1,2-diacylglycerol 3-alpha-glucosyltransferase
VIPTGLPESQFVRGNGIRFRRAWDIAPERKVALFVGRAAFEKNIGFLLEMIAHRASASGRLMLVIAGEGPALPALRRQAEALRIEDHVRFRRLPAARRRPARLLCRRRRIHLRLAHRNPGPGPARSHGHRPAGAGHSGTGRGRDHRTGRGAVPRQRRRRNSPSNWSGCSNRPTRLLIMADEAIAFAREWDAASQGARLAALYREWCAPPRAIDCSQPLAASR